MVTATTPEAIAQPPAPQIQAQGILPIPAQARVSVPHHGAPAIAPPETSQLSSIQRHPSPLNPGPTAINPSGALVMERYYVPQNGPQQNMVVDRYYMGDSGTSPVPAELTAPETMAASYVLSGVMTLGEKSVALFKRDQEVLRVYLGESILNGWTLTALNNQSVTLQKGNQRRSLQIGEFL